MNRISYILILLAGMALLGALSCKKLPRDNPLDQHNNADQINGVALQFSKYDVVFDNNQDGFVNQNEMVYLKVYIKNTGSSMAHDVQASITSTSNFVSNVYPVTQVKYSSGTSSNEISSGYDKYGYYSTTPDYADHYTVRFKVAENTPPGTEILFRMHMTDMDGNVWEDAFTVTVVATEASLNYSKHSVVYDNNDDGIINQNETVYLKVYIKNNGSSTANGVKAVISTKSSFVSNVNPVTAVSYSSNLSSNDLAPGAEKYGFYSSTPDFSNHYTVRFEVAENTPAETEITFNMLMTDVEGNEWEDEFTVVVNATDALLNYSKHSVVYDNNDDGMINPNETVYLKVYIKNNGSSKANNVKATITSSSSYISELNPVTDVNYNSNSSSGDINPGYEKYGFYSSTPDFSDHYTVRFKVAGDTPDGTDITFNMHMTDAEGNEWEDEFTVEVSATDALLNYSKHSVVYDNNDNGKINPGETVYLKVYVKNNGTSKANDVKATITSSSSFVSDLNPVIDVNYNSNSSSGDINPGYEKYGFYSSTPDFSNHYTVRFKVSETTPVGTDIKLIMAITDAEGNEWSDSFTVTVE